MYLGRELDNHGTANWLVPVSGSHYSSLDFTNGTINNYATFTIADNNPLAQVGAWDTDPGHVNTFSNLQGATFTKNGAGAVVFGYLGSAVVFNNAGAVNVNAGGLELDGGGTQSGSFMIAGELWVDGGLTFTSTSSISGTGSLVAEGGTTTFSSTVAANGNTLRINGGTVNFAQFSTFSTFAALDLRSARSAGADT